MWVNCGQETCFRLTIEDGHVYRGMAVNISVKDVYIILLMLASFQETVLILMKLQC